MGRERKIKVKKVSVVVPCYNASEYLEKCIDQLLCQTIGIDNIEIILVDDASTDGGATWNLITEYEKKFPDTIIAVALEQNMRQGGARNVGVSYADGEYLMFCDADDWLLEDALLRCYQTAKKYDADVVEFRGKTVKSRGASVTVETGDKSQLIEINTEEERKQFLLLQSGLITYASQRKLYRLSMVLENHITFVEHLIFEEPSFTLPVRLYENRHYFLDEKLYAYYLSPESTLRSTWSDDIKVNNIKVWTHIMDDLTQRGMLERYYPELEYMFLRWGLGLSISMPLQKGYFLTREEVQFFLDMTLEWFPGITGNQYADRKNGAYIMLLLKLFDMEITDESVAVINDVFKKYI